MFKRDRMNNIIYVIALSITVTFSSCTSEKSYYDTLGDGEIDQLFTGSKDDIINYIGQTAYDELTQVLKFPINTGNTPPTINGNFQMNEIGEYNVSTSTIDGPFGYYVEYSMNSQDNDALTINYTARFLNYGLDGIPFNEDDELYAQETGIGQSFLSGKSASGDFTVIVKTQVTTDRVDIIALSGRRGTVDINSMQYAYVSFDNGDPDTGAIEGSARLIDWDGTSEGF
jgi:hypothetical protein